MTARFQRVAALAMLIAVVGISVLLLRNAPRSQGSTRLLPVSTGRDAQEVPPLPWTGPVTAVVDGDTIEVDQQGQTHRVRIYGIDCPEQGQPFAEEAREFAALVVAGKEVSVTPVDVDRLDRIVADVAFLDNDTMRHLNHELLDMGLAWWYRTECPEAHHLESLEAGAREAKRGLWADPSSIPPWEYREMAQRARSTDGTPQDPSTPPR